MIMNYTLDMYMAISYHGCNNRERQDSSVKVCLLKFFNFASCLGRTKVLIKPHGELDYFGEVDKNGKACGFGRATTENGYFTMKF